MSEVAEEAHVVHEAVGPPLSGLEVAGALGVGVNSLLVLGVVPVLLGALADERRLSDPDIGLVATIEVLAMGITTALAGMLVKPKHLRLIGLVGTSARALADYATASSSRLGVFALRGAAGAIEGVLLWITVSMIARTATPERWAGVFFAAQTLSQLVLAIAFALWILPLGGATGGFLALAVCALLGTPAALI